LTRSGGEKKFKEKRGTNKAVQARLWESIQLLKGRGWWGLYCKTGGRSKKKIANRPVRQIEKRAKAPATDGSGERNSKTRVGEVLLGRSLATPHVREGDTLGRQRPRWKGKSETQKGSRYLIRARWGLGLMVRDSIGKVSDNRGAER